MQYYLQLENSTTFFRLKEGNVWTRIPYNEINSTFADDLISLDYYELGNHLPDDSVISLEGEDWSVNPKNWRFGDRNILYKTIYLKRKEFPITPQKHQLIEVIKNGNDRVNNSLILNVDGEFQLFENFHNGDAPTVVVRYETAIANNGYIGEKASADNNYIDAMYISMLRAWYNHLLTNKLNSYTDNYNPEDSAEKLIEKINILKENF